MSYSEEELLVETPHIYPDIKCRYCGRSVWKCSTGDMLHRRMVNDAVNILGGRVLCNDCAPLSQWQPVGGLTLGMRIKRWYRFNLESMRLRRMIRVLKRRGDWWRRK
ncbi:MAG: hypothetical protein JRD89_17600 [Deltaproteobacteria bacterium]|nr:hypothetical protein [Deltaproteobacteria bacterium]